MSKKSGLADSPFFTHAPPETKLAPPPDESPQKLLEAPESEPAPREVAGGKNGEVDAIPKSKLASMQANKQESKLANKQTSKHESMQAIMHAYLNEKVDDIATFRYPVELLEKLEDIIHQVRKDHHRKVTKQAVAVAALAFLLTDFETFGEESMLYRLLVKPDE